jgi:hypothetical protein
MQAFMYAKTSPHDNHYAHPIDIVPLLDLNLGKARVGAWGAWQCETLFPWRCV